MAVFIKFGVLLLLFRGSQMRFETIKRFGENTKFGVRLDNKAEITIC